MCLPGPSSPRPSSPPPADGHATTTYPLAALAARGYAILRCNVRGSSGYGKEFRHTNHKDWGGGDYHDLMTGVDHVIEQGVADPGRLGVMGWSYGGYMTSWVIGHTAAIQGGIGWRGQSPTSSASPAPRTFTASSPATSAANPGTRTSFTGITRRSHTSKASIRRH